ncbi:SIR2 family NAD-dependent protein deacylase [Paucihalobacter sp.]|uniref:SIR2 family NAD-dependent protein deacylase n=1 Tax=Paucihalobacter sp. TaxID=2850405 RepID=UPI003D160B7F
MKNLVVLTGAGISAESGLKTFRDANGLWEGHDVMSVASPEGFRANPELVLEFYNQRRRQLLEVKPNSAHFALATLEKQYKVSIITQNVDDLHERAGSEQVIHLHGELKKVRSAKDESLVYLLNGWELKWGDVCELGSQLRPHIVWFGEAVPMMNRAADIMQKADIVAVIGTSLQVYPAAGLIHYAASDIKKYYLDPKAATILGVTNLYCIKEKAASGIETLKTQLFQLL